MSETAPEAAQPEEQAPPAEQPVEETDWKAEARKWEQRAKENKKAADQLEQQRKASLTEAERAVIEAEERGRTSALTEVSKERAADAFLLAAARRNPTFDASKVLARIDRSQLLDDGGRLDERAVAAAVADLVPEVAPSVPSFDGGVRRTAPSAQGPAQEFASIMQNQMRQ